MGRPLRIGLTGGIASGKTVVAQMLRDLGAVMLDADAAAREVTAPGGPAFPDIVRAFGEAIVGPDGTLDRGALAARIFGDARARQRLNAITHPHIRRRMLEELARVEAAPGGEIIILDIPLLLDTTDGREYDLDGVVVVFADAETRVRRLAARDGLTPDDALRRIASQVPLEEKAARADWVIDNQGPLEETRRQVNELWTTLEARQQSLG